MTFTGNIDKNIILRPLLTSRRFSHQKTVKAGILTSLHSPDTFPPYQTTTKGSGVIAGKTIKELTAAGQSETFTPFPFERFIRAPQLSASIPA